MAVGDLDRVDVVDVCVVGGGPAGSIAARRLAELGHRVCLIDSPGAPAGPSVQHLAAAAIQAFESVRSLDALHRATYARAEARLVAWDTPAHYEPSSPAGMLIDRRVLDRCLLDEARTSGVDVWADATVDFLDRQRDNWLLAVRRRSRADPANRDGTASVRARVVVLAGGPRCGLGGRAHRTAPRTFALHGVWACGSSSVLRIEALRDGWLWGAPGPDGTTHIVAFAAAADIRGLSRADRADLYRSLVRSSTVFDSVSGPPADDTIAVHDATPSLHPRPAEPFLLRAGACAGALDPLSSQGVQSAIRSAIHAAAAAHTMLTPTGDVSAAVDFHILATRRNHDRHRRFAADLYGLAAARFSTPFWERSASGSVAPQIAPLAQFAAPARTDRLQWSAAATWRAAPVLEGSIITTRTALHRPLLEQPVAFIGDTPMSMLRGLLPATLDSVERGALGRTGADLVASLFQVGVVECAGSSVNAADSAASSMVEARSAS